MPGSVYLSRFGERPGQTLEGGVEHEEVDSRVLAFHNAHADKVVAEAEQVRYLHFRRERTDDGQQHYYDCHAVNQSLPLEIVFRHGVGGDDLRRHAEQRHESGVQHGV